MAFMPFLDPTADPSQPALPYAQPPTGSSTAALNQYLQTYRPPTPPPDQGPPIYNSPGYTYGGGALGDDPVKIPTVHDNTDFFNELMDKFAKKSDAEKRKWALWLAIGGFMPGGVANLENVKDQASEALRREVDQGYGNLLAEAATMYQSGIKITPEELLRREIGYRLGSAGVDWDGKLKSLDGDELTKLLEATSGASSEPELKDGKFVTTSTYLDFMDPMDAKAMARGVLQSELGRDPTEAEYQDFISAIHAAERRDPTRTRTTTTYEDGELVNTRSVTHQGMSAAGIEQFAIEKARRNPDWAEWQAVGTYAPALFAALGATIPGV